MSNLCNVVRECANRVFVNLGRGHSEAIYANALFIELSAHHECTVSREVILPVTYSSECAGGTLVHQVGALRADLVVQTRHTKIDVDVVSEEIVVELKAVNSFTDNHVNQVLCYMRCRESCTGSLLLNFCQADMLLKESVAFKINKAEVLSSSLHHSACAVDWLFINKV